MGTKIGIILIIVCVLGVALFVYNSGFLSKSPGSFGSLFSIPTSSFHFLSFGAPATGPSSPFGPSSPTISGQTSTINPADIPPGFTLAQLSPYFNEVKIGYVYPGTASYYGQISLYAYLNNGQAIDITGWQIKTQRSGEYIPQAIDVYDPTGLTPASDIRVKDQDVVYLYSSWSPFNLRINECVGYLGHAANFSPSLPGNCPSVDPSQIEGFTGSCQNYLKSLGLCQVPDPFNPAVPRTDYACQDYIQNNFNYKSCFEAHSGDTNFLSNQVWVWTGANVADPYHDVVDLLDNNGLLVNQYTY